MNGLDLSHVGVAALTAGLYYLARTLFVMVQQKRFQNGSDRRRPVLDEPAVAWRATITLQMTTLIGRVDALHTAVHLLRTDDLQPLVLRVALAEKDIDHLQKLLPEHRREL